MVIQSANDSSDSSLTGSPIQMVGLGKRQDAQHHSMRTWDPNPYFQHANLITLTASTPSPPLGTHLDRTASPSGSQPRRATPALGHASARSVSPASMVGGYKPFAGTSSDDFPYLHLHQDRFPLIGAEAHTPTAIKG